MKVLIITVVMSFALSFFSFSGGAFADDGMVQDEDVFEEPMYQDDGQIEPMDDPALEEFDQDENFGNDEDMDNERNNMPSTEDEDNIDERN